MLSNPQLTYVLVGILIVAVIAAAIAVFRTRTKATSRILDRGWQFYFTPTTLEPPGTVFRIDSDHRRFIVDTLPVKKQLGQEAFGESTECVSARQGTLLNFLGLKAASLKSGVGQTEELVFKLDQPQREIVSDAELDQALKAFFGTMVYRADNRYFVIRECRKAKGMTHHLTSNQVADLGGEATLTSALSVKGKLFRSKRGTAFILEKDFDKFMRVMFLAEEITTISAGLGGERPQLGRIPVKEVLQWDEG